MSEIRFFGARKRLSVRLALGALLFVVALPAFAQTRQVFMFHETDSAKIEFRGQQQTWNADIPNKQRVRVLTNLVEFPDRHDPVAERDITIQFYDHLARNHMDVLEKMRNHGRRAETWVQSASSRSHYSNAGSGNYTYDVVLIDDFTYTPRKEPQAKTPGYLKAMEILGLKP